MSNYPPFQIYMSIYDTELLSRTALYEGAKISVMDAVVKYLQGFIEHPSLSWEALSGILRMEHIEILPPGNKLPASYEEALQLVEPFLIQPILFHACPNDCITQILMHVQSVHHQDIVSQVSLPNVLHTFQSFRGLFVYLDLKVFQRSSRHMDYILVVSTMSFMIFIIPQSGSWHILIVDHFHQTHVEFHLPFVQMVLIPYNQNRT